MLAVRRWSDDGYQEIRPNGIGPGGGGTARGYSAGNAGSGNATKMVTASHDRGGRSGVCPAGSRHSRRRFLHRGGPERQGPGGRHVQDGRWGGPRVSVGPDNPADGGSGNPW